MKTEKRNAANKKRTILNQMMEDYAKENVIVAFSGGADSSLLLKLACDKARDKETTVYAVTVHTKLHPKGDLETAGKIAGELGAVHKIVEIDELEETGIKNNPIDRCYRCKKGIFQKIKSLANELNIRWILEGTNEDDLHEYRPGIKALEELQIISPLAKAGMTKAEVRKLASELGVSTADRPASPCLATRLPYGTQLSYELLERIDKGEMWLRNLGYYNVRLRVHNEVARIEVDKQDIPRLILQSDGVISKLKEFGFRYITVDLEGFRSGSMDGETECFATAGE